MSVVFMLEDVKNDLLIADAEYDIAMAECRYLEAMIDSRLSINLAKSELKCMKESTAETFVSDLAYLFNEAEKEAEGQKQGFFSKMFATLKKWFIDATNAVYKLFTDKNTKAWEEFYGKQIVVPFDPTELLDNIQGVVDSAKSTPLENLGKVGATIAAFATVVIGGKNAFQCVKNWNDIMNKYESNKSAVKVNGKQVEGWIKKAQILLKSATEVLNAKEEETKKNESNPEIQEGANKCTGMLASAKTYIKKLISKIQSWLPGSKNNDGNGENQDTPDDKKPENGEGGNGQNQDTPDGKNPPKKNKGNEPFEYTNWDGVQPEKPKSKASQFFDTLTGRNKK